MEKKIFFNLLFYIPMCYYKYGGEKVLEKSFTGELIRKYRIEKGLTQKQLGEKCGINEANIRKYELGTQKPKIETLERIAAGLDIPLSKLSGYTVIPKDEIQRALDTMLEEWKREERSDEAKLLEKYNLLNELGKLEAYKRLEEMTELKKYRKLYNVSIDDL